MNKQTLTTHALAWTEWAIKTVFVVGALYIGGVAVKLEAERGVAQEMAAKGKR